MGMGMITAKSEDLAKELVLAYQELHEKLGYTEDARRCVSFIAETFRLVGRGLSCRTTIEQAAKYATPFLADYCAIDILENGSVSRVTLAAETIMPFQPLPKNVGSFIKEVIRSREPLRLTPYENQEFFATFSGLDAKNAILMPLVFGETEIGLMALVNKDSRQRSPLFYTTVVEYAERISMLIDHARMHAELQNALKAREEFISIASHELQNPLTVLKLQLGMMQLYSNSKEITLPPKIAKAKEAIEKAVEKLSWSVEDLFDVARMSSNQFEIMRNSVNLTKAFESVLEQTRPILHLAGCDIRTKLEPKVIGNWDKARMEQVLVNLLTNASKYAPNGPIDVTLFSDGPYARISVKDSGPGIPAESQSQIFDSFERLGARKAVKGLGLGLYICKKIVNAHGGRIWTESEPGQGANFKIDLPLDHQSAGVL